MVDGRTDKLIVGPAVAIFFGEGTNFKGCSPSNKGFCQVLTKVYYSTATTTTNSGATFGTGVVAASLLPSEHQFRIINIT